MKRNFIQKLPPYLLFSFMVHTAKIWNDKLFLKIVFPLRVGYRLNLENPKTFNEKLQWLKLHNRKLIMTSMVDKVEAKKIAASIIGEQYIIPTINVYNTVEEIDWATLPNRFVLKCTHDSGGIVICRDKAKLDINRAKKKLKKGLATSYFLRNRELPYKSVNPRIIAEPYLEDSVTKELRDYKFFCFNGCPKAMYVATDRFGGSEETKFDFYDMNFNHLPFVNAHPNSTKQINKPAQFDLMKKLASKLSLGHPHLRVDFYEVDGRVFFGEMTFYHMSGMSPFVPKEWDYIFGNWLQLPK